MSRLESINDRTYEYIKRLCLVPCKNCGKDPTVEMHIKHGESCAHIACMEKTCIEERKLKAAARQWNNEQC